MLDYSFRWFNQESTDSVSYFSNEKDGQLILELLIPGLTKDAFKLIPKDNGRIQIRFAPYAGNGKFYPEKTLTFFISNRYSVKNADASYTSGVLKLIFTKQDTCPETLIPVK